MEDNAKDKDFAAAREELGILERLSAGLSAEIATLTKRPQLQGNLNATELVLLEINHAKWKAYEELAHCCYGRTSIGTEVDDSNQPLGRFTYRITQANVGFIDGDCIVLARNSPLASALVSGQPGEETEITTPRDRYLNVEEVRIFDGPVSLRSPNQQPNFRSMAIRRLGSARPAVVEDLRETLRNRELSSSYEGARLGQAVETLPQALPWPDEDPTWLQDWARIYLSEADELSLGHQFITRTTQDQERALNNPRGLTFVEGIAGAGKTSVALGRLKFFANFATGAQREHYGLLNASEKDFSPVGMVGFVLSHSLKRYLRETANALGLQHLPIRDFEEFRADLSGHFGITDRFRKKKGETSSIRGRIQWLRAVDAAMARAAGNQLLEKLASLTNTPNIVSDSVSKLAHELIRAEPQPNSKIFHLNGLASRLVNAVADAELRDKEAEANREFQPRGKPDSPEFRLQQASLEREMRRIQQEAEKKIVSPFARALLVDLTAPDLISHAVALEFFPKFVQQAFGFPSQGAISQDLENAVVDIRALLKEGGQRSGLADADLVMLVALAGMIAVGFDHVDQGSGLGHLYQIRRHTAVFIDEVQDFTEIEVLLMGMTATGTYHQITLSGDGSQRLQSGGAEAYDDLFPWVPRSLQNRNIFLGTNFRQRDTLAALSAGFRFLIQNDRRVDFQTMESHGPAAIHTYDAREEMSELILRKIRSVPRQASIAVVVPSIAEAQIWFDLLEEDVSALHRPALMSRRDDLTRRFNIHFTEVRETKGLEFDVIVVPNIGSYDLELAVGRNQLYVAISRAKHALLLGCLTKSLTSAAIEALKQNSLVHFRNLPPD